MTSKIKLENILIHIGFSKTGSKWLQHELFSNNNIFEPISRNNNGKSSFARMFYTNCEGYLLSPFEDNYNLIINKFNKIIRITGKNFHNKIPVISDERLSGYFNGGGFDSKTIADRIKKVFPNAKIFIVIREQNSYIISSYLYYLAGGGIKSLKRYLSTKYYGTIPFFSPDYLNYLPLVQYYFKLFGQKNVLVLPYEMLKNKPDIFIQYLERFLNIQIIINKKSFDNVWNEKNILYYYFQPLNFLRKLLYFFKNNPSNNDPLVWIIKKSIITLSNIMPSKFINKSEKMLYNEILDFTSNRYTRKNKELSELIQIDLSVYGYF